MSEADVTDLLLSAPCEECGNTIVGNIREMADEGEYTFPLYCKECKAEDELSLKELVVRRFTSRRLQANRSD